MARSLVVVMSSRPGGGETERSRPKIAIVTGGGLPDAFLSIGNLGAIGEERQHVLALGRGEGHGEFDAEKPRRVIGDLGVVQRSLARAIEREDVDEGPARRRIAEERNVGVVDRDVAFNHRAAHRQGIGRPVRIADLHAAETCLHDAIKLFEKIAAVIVDRKPIVIELKRALERKHEPAVIDALDARRRDGCAGHANGIEAGEVRLVGVVKRPKGKSPELQLQIVAETGLIGRNAPVA
jgi:hypothetical protein